MANRDIFDVTIIGGGPAGLYSAFYSGLRGMKTKIIEFQPRLGGKLHVYPEKMIWDVGGQTPIRCEQLITQLVEQGLTFDPTVCLDEKVESMNKNEDGLFVLAGASGEVHYSKSIIVAVGGGILKPQKLQIEGAERFEVANLNYTVKTFERFRGSTVLISGGGNSAVDWANELEPIAEKVYVVHRKPEMAGHEAQVRQLLEGRAECLLDSAITRLVASDAGDRIELVEVMNQVTGERRMLPVDQLVINHGYERDASLLENSPLDLETKDDFYLQGTPASETSVPGVFAAGDILQHEGKLNLIAGTFTDAANAVNKAKKFIEPDAANIAMVSSHNDVFNSRNQALKKQAIR